MVVENKVLFRLFSLLMVTLSLSVLDSTSSPILFCSSLSLPLSPLSSILHPFSPSLPLTPLAPSLSDSNVSRRREACLSLLIHAVYPGLVNLLITHGDGTVMGWQAIASFGQLMTRGDNHTNKRLDAQTRP